ncbi:MAG: sulfite exporter TauE/SafE family protein [Candidatus Micrarchaeota archaeon]|nr:sulfite exporter TauE/SafE family protein [Candidatus Micrarchaeota archaeon]
MGPIPKYLKEKKIIWKYVLPLSVVGIIGSYIGSNALLAMNEDSLTGIIGIAILLALPILFLKRDLGVKRRVVTREKRSLGYISYFLIITFYALIGAGVGVLISYVLMLFFGFTIIEAKATDTIPHLLLAVMSLIIFSASGIVDYALGIVLFIGMLAGGYIGAHAVVRIGDKWVKIIFIITVVFSGVKLLFF